MGTAKVSNRLKAVGKYQLWDGGELIDGKMVGGRLIKETHNMILDGFYNNITNGLMGNATTSREFGYFVLGTGTTAVSESDTELVNQVFIKQETSKSVNGKIFVALCQLNTDEANYSIKEVGVQTTDNTLISRALFSIEKNSSITYNLIWQLTLSEV